MSGFTIAVTVFAAACTVWCIRTVLITRPLREGQ